MNNMLYGTYRGNTKLTEYDWSKEECLISGISNEEYNIQKALGSLPVHTLSPLDVACTAAHSIVHGVKEVIKGFDK